MGGRPHQRDGPAAHAAYWALRGAMLAPRTLGLTASLRAAGVAGRAFGASAVNRARVARACERLSVAMPELDEAGRRELVLRSYEHLAKLAVEVALLPRMITPERWPEHVRIGAVGEGVRAVLQRRPVMFITGHCGNWEVVGATLGVLGVPMRTLYRPLDLAPLDRWMRRTRARQGLHLLDKFEAGQTLPGIMDRREPVAFVADQNAGDKGLFVPFFGRLASTYKTIGLLAVRHRATVVCGQAVRLEGRDRPAVGYRPRYHLTVDDVFGPEAYEGRPDPVYYVTARYRRAIELMVRRTPEQYLWMHRAWKSRPAHERRGEPFPGSLREKMAALPWMSAADVEAVVDRSAQDAALLSRLGTDRLP